MEKADVALYHRVLRRENFEKAAKDLVSLVYAAEKKEPGKPRILILISTDTAMRRMGLMWICWSFKRNLD